MSNSESRTWADMLAANPDHSQFYIDRFKAMEVEGRDLHGEARLVDAMAARGSRILDAGCGPGRVGGHLAQLGHTVIGVDLDPVLIKEAQTVFPGSTWIVGDLAELDLAELDLSGRPPSDGDGGDNRSSDNRSSDTPGDNRSDGDNRSYSNRSDDQSQAGKFDLVVSTGNVLPFVQEDLRHRVVQRLAAHLGEGGRLVVGFGNDRGYSFEQFFDDAAAAGLSLDLALATWDLQPFRDDSDFLVAVFSHS